MNVLASICIEEGPGGSCLEYVRLDDGSYKWRVVQGQNTVWLTYDSFCSMFNVASGVQSLYRHQDNGAFANPF